jgi:hypothetical protein
MSLPAARVIPHQPLARARATAIVAARRLRHVWARIAMRVLVLALTAVGFAGLLAMTFVLAESAITVHPVVAPHYEDRPLEIILMHAPAAPVHGTMATLRATQGEVESGPIDPSRP